MVVSEGTIVTTIMVAIQFLEIGCETLMKSANKDGMSIYIFNLYSNLLALSFLLPSTIFYHRKTPPPPISTSIFCRNFLLSFLSTAVQTLSNIGIGYSSITLASALVDLVPAFTFILAVILRMENVNVKHPSSQAKIIGTVVSIGGALTVTLYKGIPLISDAFQNMELGEEASQTYISNWILGAFLLSISSFCLSVLYIVQAWIIKDYPEELVVNTISCGFRVILFIIIALIGEGNSKAWILKSNKELISVCFSAIFLVSMRNVIHTWATRLKGPIYVAMFNPLKLVIALCMGVIILRDNLYLGSVIGATIIAVGFYLVIWAQSQEEHTRNEKDLLPSSSTSLLSS